MRKKLMIALMTAALAGSTAGAAFAGEITGNGKPIQVKAKSVCAYSGLDDPDDDFFGRTQNYGQALVILGKEAKPFIPSPGEACNPARGGEH